MRKQLNEVVIQNKSLGVFGKKVKLSAYHIRAYDR